MIAKRRVDFVAGNINSYARMLNGPKELERIKTYNHLAASMAELRNEQDAMREVARAKKKRDQGELAKIKLESTRKATENKELLVPICREHVEKGLEHVLTLNVG